MRRFVKVMVILACVFLTVGIGFSVAGAAMGATMEDADFSTEFRNGARRLKNFMFMDNDWDDDHDDDYDDHDGDDYDDHRTERSAASSTEDDVRKYTVDAVDEIEIDLHSDELIFKTHSGSQILVEVRNDTKGNVEVRSDSQNLEIESTKNKRNRSVTVLYPVGKKFSSVDICVGAGYVELQDDLAADELSLEIGAGEFVGKGSVTADTLDIQVGAGSAELKSLTAGYIDGECGIGSLFLSIKGKEEDYNYNLECGIGEISIGSKDYSGLAREKDITYPGANGEIDLECGIGEIEIKFE